MHALVSLLEDILDQNGTVLGKRVVQVSDSTFEVFNTLVWIDSPDYVTADVYYYDPADKSFKINQAYKEITAPPDPSEDPAPRTPPA